MMLTDAEARQCADALLFAGESFESAGSTLTLSEQLRVCALLPDDFRPHVLDGLTNEIKQREAAGVTVREIELAPRFWFALARELGPLFGPAGAGSVDTFLGIPIRKGTGSSWCCGSCGAPREDGHRCSYCLQPYDRITINGEILQ